MWRIGATKCEELYCGSCELWRIVLWELRKVKTCIVGATKCKVLYCGSYLLGCYPPLYGERVQKKGSRVKKKRYQGQKKRVAGSKKRGVGSKKRVLGSKKNKEGRVKKKGEWGQKKKGRVKKKGDQISGTLFFDPGSKETDLGSKKKVGSKKKKVGSKKRPAQKTTPNKMTIRGICYYTFILDKPVATW